MGVAVVYARSLVAEFRARRLDTSQLLAASGLSAGRVLRGFPMLSYEEAVRLTEHAVAMSGDEGIGHAAGANTPTTALKLVSLMMMTQPTLRAAAKTFERYSRLIADGTRFALIEGGETAKWSMMSTVQPNEQTRVMTDFGLALTAKIASDLTGIRENERDDPALREVHFVHAEPSYAHEYRKAYQCPVKFEQPVNALVFSSRLLSRRLPGANGLLSNKVRVLVERLLREVFQDRNWADRVRLALEHADSLDGLSAASLAAQMQVSERSLRRRLEREKTSFAALLDEVRTRRARDALLDSEVSVSELAEQLGFSGVSSFGRAFRAWTGSSPSTYRRRHRGG